MNKTEAIDILKDCLKEIPELAKLARDNREYKLWTSKVEELIKNVLDKNDLVTFWSTNLQVPNFDGFTSYAVLQDFYLKRLHEYGINIEKIIQKYELLGFETKSTIPKVKHPKAFIAHEGETKQLKKLKDFLDALGIEYFIAEVEASDGRSIEGQVDWTQAKADFAICLATKGKAFNKKTGKYYMGLNVADELGRARQVFKNHIILLVQQGVEVHTTIREIVYAPFTIHSMDTAFVKIIRELRNWGFIHVGAR